MTEILERVAAALGQPVAITIRMNKASVLPFEVVDTSGEPVVLSAWLEHDVAAEEAQHMALLARARNAIMAMREPTIEMLDAGNHATAFWMSVGKGMEAQRNKYAARWRAMIDAALEGAK